MFPANKVAYSPLDGETIAIMSSSKDKGQLTMWSIDNGGDHEPIMLCRYDDLELMGKQFFNMSKKFNFTVVDNKPRTAVLKYQMVKGGLMKHAHTREVNVPLTVYAESCFKAWKKKPHAILLENKDTNPGFHRFTVRVTDKGTEMLSFDQFGNMSRLPQMQVVADV